MERSKGTKDQVPLACKVAISDFMVIRQHIKQSTSLKVRGSRVEGDITRDARCYEEEAATKVMLVVRLCLGRNTMGCCRCAKGAGV